MAKAILFMLVIVFGAVASSPLENKHHKHHHHHRACGECDPDSCFIPTNCLAGMVKDHCGCCMVCGRSEGEKCDNPDLKKELGYAHKYGICGEHLECNLRDDLEDQDAPEALCFCKQKEMVCGTDGKSYPNICQLQEEAYRKRDGLKQSSRGPCKAVPWIVTGPESVTSDEGANVALSCEAMGYPVPSMEWRMTRPDGSVVTLPRDDQHIAAQLRGGPEQYEITGWLQILSLKPDDEGTYNCVAKNAEGEVMSPATINVNLKVTTDDEAEYDDDEADEKEAAESKENKI